VLTLKLARNATPARNASRIEAGGHSVAIGLHAGLNFLPANLDLISNHIIKYYQSLRWRQLDKNWRLMSNISQKIGINSGKKIN